MGDILGIDLGTTNVSASLIRADGREIALRLGRPVHPEIMRSAVLFRPSGDIVAGDQAPDEHQRWLDEHHGASSSRGGGRPRLLEAFKPLLAERTRGRTVWVKVTEPGRLADHPVDEGTTRVGRVDRYVLHTEVLRPKNCPKDFTLVDVYQAAVAVLRAVRANLEKSFGRVALDRVVVGVPVGFTDIGREKLIEAVEEAGLAPRSRVSLLHEPLAVALTYGIEASTPRRVLVFDSGGGTVDMTALDIEGHPDGEFRYRVLAQTSHDRAGRHYDRLFFKRIVDGAEPHRERILSHLGIRDPLEVEDPLVLDAVERVKERLFAAGSKVQQAYGRRRKDSGTASAEEGYPFTYPFGGLNFRRMVRSEDFTEAISEEIGLLKAELRRLLAEVAERTGSSLSDSRPAGIDEVLMAGGSSRLPCMQGLIEGALPGVNINTSYTGSRTTTAGFARAARYRRLIEELTDSRYGLLDLAAGRVEAVVSPSVPVAETGFEARAGREDGFYIRPQGKKATLLLFISRHERWDPRLCINVEAPKTDDVLQVVIEIDRETGRPVPRILSCSTGAELRPEVTTDLSGLAILEEGQVIRYRNNQHPNYQVEGIGYIRQINHIGSARKVSLAVGDMRSYRFSLNTPEEMTMKVIAHNNGIEFVEVRLPKPGDAIELNQVDPQTLKPLPAASTVSPFTRTTRPTPVIPGLARARQGQRVEPEVAVAGSARQQEASATPAKQQEVVARLTTQPEITPPLSRQAGDDLSRYCPNCKRTVRPVKNFSVGALLLWTILTAGLGLIIYPIYHVLRNPECPQCGGKQLAPSPENRASL